MAGELKGFRLQLVERCSEPLIKGLIDELIDEKILSDAEMETIIQGNALRADKCRLLIDIVIGKGDKSCNKLLQKIREKDPALSEDLGITAPVEPPTKKDQSSQQDINGITVCSEAEYQEITTKETERYPIYEKANRKRWALIICNIVFKDATLNRKGADIDLKEMTNLLEGLGYSVRLKINLTAEEMQDAMTSFAAHTDHSQSDSTFLVFMSHGAKNIIHGIDVKSEDVTKGLHVDKIFDTFNNKNCRGLRDKPKMILIQACRGNDESRVWVKDGAQQLENINQEGLEADALRSMHKESDFICFYSTTPDTFSYRDPDTGSFFIQSLIKSMKEDAHNLSIEDIFRKVRCSFQNGQQMPTLERTTSLKKFFLLPGY
ncbi:caspase-1-B-like isoform X2 [Eleutherodactylus coqui]|uniref:caspase-1-B-like isoform X2 n=1 Tax=Eleutherodactylus coqui TaxID=57060 RepID=UPI003462823F